MKVLLLIFGVCIGVSQQMNIHKAISDFEDVAEKEAKECYVEFHFNHQQVHSMLNMKNFPNDRNLKCLLACLYLHLNVVDESFNMFTDKVKPYFEVDEATAEIVYNKCKNLKGEDNCEKVFNAANCNFEKAVDDLEDVVEKEAKECYGEFHFNRQQLDSMLKMRDLPNDRNLKCYLACLFIHLNTVDESFNGFTESIKKYWELDEQTTDLVYNKCKDFKGEDNCEKSYNAANCVLEMLKDI
ncbi:hypothetical protein FQA39_LY13757 [Lamprigera yunnana]|nr:hypothetical protein FQA39_LY13757 [Lamprigera yunnana]